jgi:hypothetical protein
MNKKRERFTRRDFLQSTALVSAGLALGAGAMAAPPSGEGKPALPAPPEKPADPTRRSKVVLVRDKGAVDAKGAISAEVMAKMLDDAVCALAGMEKPAEAWKQFFGPKDRVGIKTNVWKFLATPPDMEKFFQKRIVAAGVPEASVLLTDREARTKLADCTALLNVRPVRSHHWAGVGGCIKNYIMFVEEPSEYHDDSCADLGAIWNLPIVKGKTRLNVLVALTPQFYGRGPHAFDPRHVWNYCGILVSRDPVAVDALGAELLRLKRMEFFGEDRPVTPFKHIEYAETRHGVGVADLKRIDLVKLGWKDQLLLT